MAHTTHIQVFSSGSKVMPVIAVCTVQTEGRFHRVQMYTNDTWGKKIEVWIAQTHFQWDLSAKTFYQFPPYLFWGVGSNLTDAAWLLFSSHYQILKMASSMTRLQMENGELKSGTISKMHLNWPREFFRCLPSSALVSAPAATATTISIFSGYGMFSIFS